MEEKLIEDQDKFLNTKTVRGRLEYLFQTKTIYLFALGVLVFFLSSTIILGYFSLKLANQREEAARLSALRSNIELLRVKSTGITDDVTRLVTLIQSYNSQFRRDDSSTADRSKDNTSTYDDSVYVLKLTQDAAAKVRLFTNELDNLSVSPNYSGRIPSGSPSYGNRAFVYIDTARDDLVRVQTIISSLPDKQSDPTINHLLDKVISNLSDVSDRSYKVFSQSYSDSMLLQFESMHYSTSGSLRLHLPRSLLMSEAFADNAASPAATPAASPPTALAAPTTTAVPLNNQFTQEEARLYIFMAIFCILMITFLASLVTIFTTSNQAVLNFSFDTVKTLLGFFIGAATVFLGLPGHG